MDYAMQKGVSLSTLRRHIKANKIRYRVENGRYLIWTDAAGAATSPVSTAPQSSGSVHEKLSKLERDLRKAQEEIAELKMLVALYEEKISRDRLDS